MSYQNFTHVFESLPSSQHQRGQIVVITANHLGLMLQKIPDQVNPVFCLFSSPPVIMKVVTDTLVEKYSHYYNKLSINFIASWLNKSHLIAECSGVSPQMLQWFTRAPLLTSHLVTRGLVFTAAY